MAPYSRKHCDAAYRPAYSSTNRTANWTAYNATKQSANNAAEQPSLRSTYSSTHIETNQSKWAAFNAANRSAYKAT